MNWAFWFMALQVVSCLGGALAFGFGSKDFWVAWIWASYATANVGFVMKALGY